MNISTFAEQHRLKVSRDECGDACVLGRIGTSNIYEYSANELGVMFITDGKKAPRTGLWKKFSAACFAAGMTLRQSGDAEGSFSFDPTDRAEAKVAIKGIRARVKRQMTPDRVAAMTATLAKARFYRSEPWQEAIS
jgi:hypothetical protein